MKTPLTKDRTFIHSFISRNIKMFRTAAVLFVFAALVGTAAFASTYTTFGNSLLGDTASMLRFFEPLDSPTTRTTLEGEPFTTTDKTGFLAGETVQITGSGYQPGQVVTLQVTHLD